MTNSLTTQQACTFLGCGRGTLRKHVKAGRVKLCTIGREHRYLEDDLKALFDYASRGDNSNVVNFGKQKQKKEARKCQSTYAEKHGGLTTPTTQTSEYARLLELKTEKKPKNYTTR